MTNLYIWVMIVRNMNQEVVYKNDISFAVEMDEQDPLVHFRKEFLFPQHQGKNVLYFTGNSLGLQPRRAKEYILQELEDWENLGVEGHFQAKNPWFSYHEPFSDLLAPIVGAKPSEVVAMGTLTNNLHLLMVSFYRPTKQRYKIITEARNFPSDQYALDSQVRFHGFEPKDAIIEIAPREGETFLRTEDILACIEDNSESLALVMMSGVNYLTGQYFDLSSITQKAHEVGAFAGFDLAHAAGNVALQLHNWEVDFAVWCSYKYLNSGPGSIAGIFVHEKHHTSSMPRFEGWWGTKSDTRFLMKREIEPFQTAEAWQLSNAPVFAMAIHRASLELFNEAGMSNLVNKSKLLSGYLRFLLEQINHENKDVLTIVSPENEQDRGCQVSVILHNNAKKVFQELMDDGIVTDWREPNIIRVAPVPMYCSFVDVYLFVERLRQKMKINV